MNSYQSRICLRFIIVAVILLQACNHTAPRKITGFKRIQKVMLSEDSLVMPSDPDMLISIDSQHIAYGHSASSSIVIAEIATGNPVRKFDLAPFIDIGKLAVLYFKYDTTTEYYKKAYDYSILTNAGQKPVKVQALQNGNNGQFLFCTVEIPRVEIKSGADASANDTVVLHTSVLYMVAEVNLQKGVILQTHYYIPSGNDEKSTFLYFESTSVGAIINGGMCYTGILARPDYKGLAIVKRHFPSLDLAKAQPTINYQPITGLPPFYTKIVYFGKNDKNDVWASVDNRLYDVSTGKELADFSAIAKKHCLCVSFIPIKNTDNEILIANLMPIDSISAQQFSGAENTLLNIRNKQVIQQSPAPYGKLAPLDNDHFVTIIRENDRYVLETYEYVQ